MSKHDPYLIYESVLGVICIICGFTIIYFIHQFRSYTTTRFLILRKPSIVIVYCGGSIFTLFALCPSNIYLELFGAQVDFFWLWLLRLFQELFVSCMLIVIAARCWLLHYNHSYSISVVDKNWKGAIDKNDTNFWLKYRRTWGDFGFIVCVAVVYTVTALVALCVVSVPALEHNNIRLLGVASLCVVAIPCYVLIFALMIKNKIKKLHLYDEFKIIKEVQYLSVSTILVIVLSILQLIDFHPVDLLTPGYMLFAFLSSYIQTRWVVKQIQKTNQLMINKKGTLKAPNVRSTQQLTMGDVLRTKDGFTMFMRHCQAELNVEGLLFICEVAQYKAKISNAMHEYEPSQDRETTASRKQSLDETVTETVTETEPPSAVQAGAKTLPDLTDLPRLKMVAPHNSEAELEEFGGNILSREWIPITKQLFKPKKRKLTDMIRKSEELKVVILSGEEEKKEKERNEIFALENEDCQIHEHAQYLFLKYVDVESDFGINVSYESRKELLLFFSHDCEKGFQFIMDSCCAYDIKVDNPLNAMAKSMIIKQFLYHLFDRTLNDVWKLLSSDTYMRFMQTKQYQYLIKKQKRNSINIS